MGGKFTFQIFIIVSFSLFFFCYSLLHSHLHFVNQADFHLGALGCVDFAVSFVFSPDSLPLRWSLGLHCYVLARSWLKGCITHIHTYHNL